jgi:hypothetical protein
MQSICAGMMDAAFFVSAKTILGALGSFSHLDASLQLELDRAASQLTPCST